MWYQTKATKVLGIKYPIVQGPFGGGYSSVELTSTVSNLGGLGSFGAMSMTPQEIIDTCNAIRAKTDKPFSINLWVSNRDERLSSFTEADFEKLKELFKPYFDEFAVPLPEMPKNLGPEYSEQVEALLEAKPPVFSFVFGIPSKEILVHCKDKGIKTVGVATTVDEAIAIEKAGVDAVVATGFEAGGHRVSFLGSADDSLTGILALIPQVADNVSIPVIAAGGIADGRGIAAALMLGADAVQIGTAFLATKQSNATDDHKRRLFSPDAKYTTLTRVFSGRLGRGLKSKLAVELKSKEHLLAPFPMQGLFLSSLRSAILAANKSEYISLWSGQSAPLLRYKDASELFNALIEQAEDLLAQRDRVAGIAG
jgi:nitronate monooxygenase